MGGRKTQFSVLRLLCQGGNILRGVYRQATPLRRRFASPAPLYGKRGALRKCAKIRSHQSRKTGEFAWCVQTYNTPHLQEEKRRFFFLPLPSFHRGERQETQAFPASIRTRADTVPAFLRCAQKLAKGTVCTSPFDYRGGRFVPCPQICSVIPQKRLRRFL